MYSDSGQISVAYTQQIIEQIVHPIYKVDNRICWRCDFGNGRIKTDLPLLTLRVKPTILLSVPRLFQTSAKFCNAMYILTACRLISQASSPNAAY